jgi:hypothetical protein
MEGRAVTATEQRRTWRIDSPVGEQEVMASTPARAESILAAELGCDVSEVGLVGPRQPVDLSRARRVIVGGTLLTLTVIATASAFVLF